MIEDSYLVSYKDDNGTVVVSHLLLPYGQRLADYEVSPNGSQPEPADEAREEDI